MMPDTRQCQDALVKRVKKSVLAMDSKPRSREIRVRWEVADIFTPDGIKDFDHYISPEFSFSGRSFALKLFRKDNVCLFGNFSSIRLELTARRLEKKSYGIGVFGIGVLKTDGTLAKFDIRGDKFKQFYTMPCGSLLLLREIKQLASDVINIMCTVTEFNDNGCIYAGLRNSLKLIKLNALSTKFENLFADKDSCDVIIQIEDKKFSVHKEVLVSQSTVFAAMFQHDSLEKQTSIINILDCDPGTFVYFLKFLYLHVLEGITFHDAFDLFITSDRYDVQDLKSFCIDYMESWLTKDTVRDVIQLAEKYDEQRLRNIAESFCKSCF